MFEKVLVTTLVACMFLTIVLWVLNAVVDDKRFTHAANIAICVIGAGFIVSLLGAIIVLLSTFLAMVWSS